MKEILVISGKGGTGKTTVTAALADIAGENHQMVLVDADVDAANLELLLEPRIEQTFAFIGGKVAVIDQESCIACGRCEEVCRFEAVRHHPENSFTIDSAFCEGCGTCVHQCPVEAIHTQSHRSGEWYRSSSAYGTLFHANLFPGEENSGKLVTQVKEDARTFGKATQADILLIDGPPGIGCPVTAALNGVDCAVIVSEPTLTGFHDMRRVKAAADFFHIPTQLVINKSDLNPHIQKEMRAFADESGVRLVGMIPYDEAIMSAQSQQRPLTRSLPADYLSLFKQMWIEICAE
jgi:MinD superfamily P-loop ATPase